MYSRDTGRGKSREGGGGDDVIHERPRQPGARRNPRAVLSPPARTPPVSAARAVSD